MALGPQIVQQEQGPRLILMFADGTQYLVGPWEAAAVLRGYAVPAPFVRSGRVYSMVEMYAEKHAVHGRRGHHDVPEGLADWDRSFMEQLVNDTDTLHDLILASVELNEYGLLQLCAQMTVDMIKGGTVEAIRTLLRIPDVALTPEEEHLAQRDHDNLLRFL